MTREEGIRRLFENNKDTFSEEQKQIIRNALDWYGRDNLLDDKWEPHIAIIARAFLGRKIYRTKV